MGILSLDPIDSSTVTRKEKDRVMSEDFIFHEKGSTTAAVCSADIFRNCIFKLKIYNFGESILERPTFSISPENPFQVFVFVPYFHDWAYARPGDHGRYASNFWHKCLYNTGYIATSSGVK